MWILWITGALIDADYAILSTHASNVQCKAGPPGWPNQLRFQSCRTYRNTRVYFELLLIRRTLCIYLDCQAVVSTLMRHAATVNDDQLMDDLRFLESSLHTRHFRNALSVSYKLYFQILASEITTTLCLTRSSCAFKVQCKIMELENQGRGPHFVNAQRDDASVIRAQVTDQVVLHYLHCF